MSKKTDWLLSAEKFIESGDYISLRAAAREIYELDEKSADGPLILAEAEAFLNNLDFAEFYLNEALSLKNSLYSNLRANFIKSLMFSLKFMPVSAISLFEKTVRDENVFSEKKRLVKELDNGNKDTWLYLKIFERYFSLAANNYALLGEAKKAKDTLYLASELSPKNSLKLYSNFLFFSNYRSLASSEAKRILSVYQKLFEADSTKEVFYRLTPKTKGRAVKIGYISGVFREHSTLSFLPGFLTPPENGKFEIYVYNLGREDKYSRKLREYPVLWRNLAALSPKDAALKIASDKLDILVDLAGHAEGSALEVLAYRPAPLQATTLGYFASVGAPFIDYVVTDKFMMPLGKSERFKEKPLILHKHSALCYAPFDSDFPTDISMPVISNGYPTFLCQQNLLKLSDDILSLWKQVFDNLGDFRLILQNKTISTKEGKAHLQKRLKNMGFKLSQITLLPFSPDYRKTMQEADIALDTAPYPGGATTCEAIYNALPVITLRGNDPWARLGASILTAAHLEELIADSPKDYAAIMLSLAKNPSKIQALKRKILSTIKDSRLMDIKGYSKELFALYQKLYEDEL